MRNREKDDRHLSVDMEKELGVIYAKVNCKNCPSEWFFPESTKGKLPVVPGSNLHSGFATCNECAVKQECFNFADAYDCLGVWGGRLFTYAGLSKLNKYGNIKYGET